MAFGSGDMVTILFTDNSNYWGDATYRGAELATDVSSTHTPAPTSRRRHARGSGAGVCGGARQRREYALDRHSATTRLERAGRFNNFFDVWDDENATIEHFNNQASRTEQQRELDGFVCVFGGEPEHAACSGDHAARFDHHGELLERRHCLQLKRALYRKHSFKRRARGRCIRRIRRGTIRERISRTSTPRACCLNPLLRRGLLFLGLELRA